MIKQLLLDIYRLKDIYGNTVSTVFFPMKNNSVCICTPQHNQLKKLENDNISRETLCSGKVKGISHVQEERSDDKLGLVTVVTLDAEYVQGKTFGHILQFLYTGDHSLSQANTCIWCVMGCI